MKHLIVMILNTNRGNHLKSETLMDKEDISTHKINNEQINQELILSRWVDFATTNKDS